jgi:peptidoglycan/xylan/chitin deacetylase (PgdA/CDA1 family)
VSDGVLSASQQVPLLDYFRVPYRRDDTAMPPPDAGLQMLAWTESGQVARALYWPDRATLGAPERHTLGRITLFGAVVGDEVSTARLASVGKNWSAIAFVCNGDGSPVASIQQDESGSIFLPFDPGQAVELLLSERYRLVGRSAARLRAKRASVRGYYAVRGLVPRRVQIALRQRMTSLQTRADFPAWPIEGSLHDLYDLILGLVARLADRPIPRVGLWPRPHSWALVLTHDVETADGYSQLDGLRGVEAEFGLRSAWNFAPKRYAVDDTVVRELRDDGHEVGVHGLYHDGRDLESRDLLERRLPEIREAAGRWHAGGFRSPALRRVYELMPLLGFDFDSSYPDTDPHGPDGGGCCSWLPYEIEDLVELPVTLPQDHTLFEILGHDDGALWQEKTVYLRKRQGMALLITHPDYMLSPQRLDAYRQYLSEFAADTSAWRPRPHEVSAWWRRRAASSVEKQSGEWRVVGPAAGEASVEFLEAAMADRVLDVGADDLSPERA